MKIKTCPNCRVDLETQKRGPLAAAYICRECGFERIIESDGIICQKEIGMTKNSGKKCVSFLGLNTARS